MNQKTKNCWNCKHLQKSVYLKLKDDTLYNVWCKKGDIESIDNCEFMEEIKNHG